MVGVARNRQMITYSDMAGQMTAIAVEAHDQVLWDIIGDVARDEQQTGHGLLSAVVVHKHGDMEPGKGFFELAKFYNRNLADRTKCWVEELKTLYEYWSVKMAVKKP